MNVVVLIAECQVVVALTPTVVVVVIVVESSTIVEASTVVKATIESTTIVVITAAATVIVVVSSQQTSKIEELSIDPVLSRSLSLLPAACTGTSTWQKESFLSTLCIPLPPNKPPRLKNLVLTP